MKQHLSISAIRCFMHLCLILGFVLCNSSCNSDRKRISQAIETAWTSDSNVLKFELKNFEEVERHTVEDSLNILDEQIQYLLDNTGYDLKTKEGLEGLVERADTARLCVVSHKWMIFGTDKMFSELYHAEKDIKRISEDYQRYLDMPKSKLLDVIVKASVVVDAQLDHRVVSDVERTDYYVITENLTKADLLKGTSFDSIQKLPKHLRRFGLLRDSK